MGWSSGSGLAEELYEEIRKDIPVAKRKKIAEKIISAFENEDADDWSEDSALWKDSGRPTWSEEDDE
jgi:hypothetical protein